MEGYVGEAIEVEQLPDSPGPIRFHWRGETYEVKAILREWVDISHGEAPERSRKWYTRRHRRYYEVQDEKGDRFILYLDYTKRSRRWFMDRKITEPSPVG